MKRIVVVTLAVQLVLLVVLGMWVAVATPASSPLSVTIDPTADVVVATSNHDYSMLASAVNESSEQFAEQYAPVTAGDDGQPVYRIYYSLLRHDSKLTIIEARVMRAMLDVRELQYPDGKKIEDYYVRDREIVLRRQLWVDTSTPSSAMPLWVDPDEWLLTGREIAINNQ